MHVSPAKIHPLCYFLKKKCRTLLLMNLTRTFHCLNLTMHTKYFSFFFQIFKVNYFGKKKTAEAFRRDGHPDWLILTGFIHDLGKILTSYGEEQWAVFVFLSSLPNSLRSLFFFVFLKMKELEMPIVKNKPFIPFSTQK